MERQQPSFLTAIFNIQTYSNLIYLFLTFPLGLLYFLFFTIGVSLGAGLAVILIGIPILMIVVFAVPGLAAFERQIATNLLGAQITPPEKRKRHDQTIKAFMAALINPAWWRQSIYLALKFPLGLLTFIATTTCTAVVVGLIFAPFGVTNVEIGSVTFGTGTFGIIGMGIGLVLAPFALAFLNRIADMWRVYTERLLSEEIMHTSSMKNTPQAYDYPQYFHEAHTQEEAPPMRNRFLESEAD